MSRDAGRERIRRYKEDIAEAMRRSMPQPGLAEFVTLRVLRTHLTPASRVLDLGGDSGNHAVELAREGHTVSFVDPSAPLIEYVRQRVHDAGIESYVPTIEVGDAGDLSRFEDASFDAVVAPGTFYFLARQDDRERAMAEITRVLKPDGRAFLVFLPRLTGLSMLLSMLAREPEQFRPGTLVRAFMQGTFRSASGKGFSDGWFPYLNEAESLFTSTGLVTLELRSIRGLAYRNEAKLWPLRVEDPQRFAQVIEILETTAGTREVLETCGEALFVGRPG